MLVQKVLILGYPIDHFDRREVENFNDVWEEGQTQPETRNGKHIKEILVLDRKGFENILNDGVELADVNIDEYWWKMVTCLEEKERVFA